MMIQHSETLSEMQLGSLYYHPKLSNKRAAKKNKENMQPEPSGIPYDTLETDFASLWARSVNPSPESLELASRLVTSVLEGAGVVSSYVGGWSVFLRGLDIRPQSVDILRGPVSIDRLRDVFLPYSCVYFPAMPAGCKSRKPIPVFISVNHIGQHDIPLNDYSPLVRVSLIPHGCKGQPLLRCKTQTECIQSPQPGFEGFWRVLNVPTQFATLLEEHVSCEGQDRTYISHMVWLIIHHRHTLTRWYDPIQLEALHADLLDHRAREMADQVADMIEHNLTLAPPKTEEAQELVSSE